MPGEAVMVVHGPEVFDCGDVAWLQGLLFPWKTVVAGVMARTAAEESGLPVTFASDVPSAVIAGTGGNVFLVNRGKTPASGRIFGEIVSSRLPRGTPLIQLECSSRTVYVWNGRGPGFGNLLAEETGFALEEAESGPFAGGEVREIRGCIPGEAVLVEGIAIGTALAETVVIRSGEKGIEAVSGLRPKDHGLEKLSRRGRIEISRAWCKSGTVRQAAPRRGDPGAATGRVLVIDHCAHDLYRLRRADTCGILAIGDDTTAVCGHICAHLGIPVFGVTDGDRDGLLDPEFFPGSVVVEVLEGRDDEAGRDLAGIAGGSPVVWSEWVARALGLLGDRCRVVYPDPGSFS
ncbi:MAG TPA: DUF2117 domain-containing protein [Methanomicrobiales archaeon]|nr:DUF2117 domain-containing protein [Methanomicrobiales archaeon]